MGGCWSDIRFMRFHEATWKAVWDKKTFLSTKSTLIDKEKLFTPFRPISKTKLTYTDHYSLLLSFKNIPLKPTQAVGCVKVTRWNTNKTRGWEAYAEMVKDNTKLKDIARVANNDPDIILEKQNNELNLKEKKNYKSSKKRRQICSEWKN